MEKCALKGDLGGRDEKVAGQKSSAWKAQPSAFREFFMSPLKGKARLEPGAN